MNTNMLNCQIRNGQICTFISRSRTRCVWTLETPTGALYEREAHVETIYI